jgi:hypothetical protein
LSSGHKKTILGASLSFHKIVPVWNYKLRTHKIFSSVGKAVSVLTTHKLAVRVYGDSVMTYSKSHQRTFMDEMLQEIHPFVLGLIFSVKISQI